MDLIIFSPFRLISQTDSLQILNASIKMPSRVVVFESIQFWGGRAHLRITHEKKSTHPQGKWRCILIKIITCKSVLFLWGRRKGHVREPRNLADLKGKHAAILQVCSLLNVPENNLKTYPHIFNQIITNRL